MKVLLIFYVATFGGEKINSVVLMDNMEQCQQVVAQVEDRLTFQQYVKCEEIK